jgi:hypothetical protein
VPSDKVVVLVKEDSLVVVKNDDELIQLLKDWGYEEQVS